jgi:non-canonical purine NTP pyrophosphatase (RdgB/HAM1 family)
MLSIREAAPSLPVWAALSSSHLGAVLLPVGLQRLYIAIDRDPAGQRAARFRCVLAVAQGAEVVACFSGAVEGRLTDAAAGGGGFGYDPIFIPEGHEATFAELPAEVKNRLSHRARALAGLLAWLEDAELTAPA